MFGLLSVALVCAQPVAAAPPTQSLATADADEATRPVVGGIVPTLMAVGPGLVVRGSGHWSAGADETARDLLWTELAGLGLISAGGAVLIGTGASRRTVGYSASAIISGVGLFSLSYLADIYGAATGLDASGAPRLEMPPLELEAGWRYIYDPQFDYRHFAQFEASGWLGRLRAEGSGLVAADDDVWQVGGELAWRPWGPTARTSRDTFGGTMAEATGALDWFDADAYGYDIMTMAGALEGRLDLAYFGPTLAGSFAEGAVGVGMQYYDYDLPDLHLGEDTATFLIGRFGFGLYLGEPDPSGGHGEVVVYYDHRRDGFTGGLATTGLSGGVIGHLGVDAWYDFSTHWGVAATAEVGSAYVTGLRLRYRL